MSRAPLSLRNEALRLVREMPEGADFGEMLDDLRTEVRCGLGQDVWDSGECIDGYQHLRSQRDSATCAVCGEEWEE